MLKDAVSAVYKGGYKIEVTFENGVTGIVDFSKYFNEGGVFEKFRDIEFFKNFSINRELGILTWGDEEVDIAPDIYSGHKRGRLFIPACGDIPCSAFPNSLK